MSLWGVVVVRDQGLTPAEHAAFAHRLGELTTYPVKKEGALPELLVTTLPIDRISGPKWH